MNKKQLFKFFTGIALITAPCLQSNVTHTNLFNPYDILLNPPVRPNACWQFNIAYEGSVKSHSYQAAEDEHGNSYCFRKKSDCVLQLYQDNQDFLAALKGGPYEGQLAQLGQQFNLDDDNGTTGLFTPCGHLQVNNWMLSARRYLPHGFFVSFYLPVIQAQLSDVCWRAAPNHTNTTFDGEIVSDLPAEVAKAADVNLNGWKRSGIGDFSAIVWWGKNFPQYRPFLRNVYLGLRTGGIFPTGNKQDTRELFGFPFGYNAGFGWLMGGDLWLHFLNHFFFGIDIELTYLFGKDTCMPVKTNIAQTDLLLFHKAYGFVEPGFVQHYTLYGKALQFYNNFSLNVAYQYTKQQETLFTQSAITTGPLVITSAESLQSWTVHNIIVGLEYDFYEYNHSPKWRPYLTFMYKHGFNGSRTMAFDTLTVQFAIDF